MVITDRLLRLGRSRFAAPAVLAMALAALAVNEAGFRSVQHFDHVSKEALNARSAVLQLRRLLVEAESAQRGYLITARGEYLQAYQDVRAELQVKLDALPQVFEPERVHATAVRQLEKGTRERISELDEVTRLFDAGERARAITLVLTDIGREKMQAVDLEVEQIQAATLSAFGERQAQLQRALASSHLGVALLVLFGLLLARIALHQLRLRDQERERQQAELQAERDKLEAQVAVRTAELTEIAVHLQRVREDERHRLARELHDEFGGLLTAAKLDVARIKSRLAPLPAEVAERLAHLVEMLDAGIALKRRIVEDLYPASVRDLGLSAALVGLCEEFAGTSGIAVATEIAELELDEGRALSAYRLVQEALTNVAKHAQARQVGVALQRAEDRVRVLVSDDGRGFDALAARGAGHGLAGLRFRIRSCGGAMHVRSAMGQGTTIEALLPLAQPAIAALR